MIAPKNEDILKEFEAYRKEGKSALLALCNYRTLPPLHQLIINSVQLDPETDIFEPTKGNGYALHLSGLEFLGNSAGVKWDPPEVTTTKTTCHYIASGYYVREYNEPSGWQGQGFWDADDVRDDLVYEYEAKGRKDRKEGEALRDYVDYCVNRDFRKQRNKKVQLAAAEANGQVLRKLLKIGKLYPKALFNSPVIILRCVMVPDLNDPATLAAINRKAIDSSVNIYGPGSQRMIPEKLAPFGEKDVEATIPDIEEEELSEEESQRFDFENADNDTQVHCLKEMIALTAYKLPINPATSRPILIESMKQERRMDLYGVLVKMPDVEDADEDDIPF